MGSTARRHKLLNTENPSGFRYRIFLQHICMGRFEGWERRAQRQTRLIFKKGESGKNSMAHEDWKAPAGHMICESVLGQ